jgi:hypothetical protein
MAIPTYKPKIRYPWLQKPNEQPAAPPPPAQNVEPVPRLALTIHEVAMALNISVGTLNKLINPGRDRRASSSQAGGCGVFRPMPFGAG